MASNRPLRPGQIWFVFGSFLLFAGVLGFFLQGDADDKWQRLLRDGVAVAAVVSDKHVVAGDQRNYHRVFVKPAAELPAETLALWRRTAAKASYPDSGELFENWEDRLWFDVGADFYATVHVGQEFTMRIDGESCMPDGIAPSTLRSYLVSGVFVGLGVLLFVIGMRRVRRAAPLLLAVALVAPVHAQAPPPHIVLILADDMGWTDLSTGRSNCGNGSPYYRTPNLDALAERGTAFVNAYSNGPNCAPSRAALWSGQWAARTGIYTVGSGNRGTAANRRLQAAPNETTLRPSFVTLAETLRATGYATGHFGKWHLGNAQRGASPTDQGFEHQAGGDQRGSVGRAGHFADEAGAFAMPGLDANDQPRQFLADRLTDEALAWMRTVRRPMFCAISHYSVHTPIEAPAADLDATPVAPPGSRHYHRRYAAMLKNLDDNVGRVVRFLAETDDPLRPGEKLSANTLLVFTSDNGGLGGYRAAGIAGGQEVTDQAPLRAGKGSLYEGGVRVPFLVRWPGVVRAGAVDETPVQLLDLYPTFAAIAGAELPAGVALDGIDLSGRLCAQPRAVAERALFWHFPGYLAASAKRGTWRTTPAASMRRGKWKAIYWFETQAWELFDLDADIGESHDLAESHAGELHRLAAELRAWLARTKAPLPRTADGHSVALTVPDAGGK